MPQWSSYQQAIFDAVANGTGHLVVEALAGSGKTTTILEALHCVPKGRAVLFCAFNKRIAEELGKRAPKGIDVATLHSLGYRAVRQAWGAARVDGDRVPRVLKGLCGTWGYADRAAAAKLVSLAKNLLAKDVVANELYAVATTYQVEGEQQSLEDLVDVACSALAACKRRDGTVDFDDMIWLPAELGLKVPAYDMVFIDETQDLNPAQLWLARAACRAGGRIVAVGDRHQAIYGFRGADSEAIPRMIVELAAQVLPLSVTYRCPQAIVTLAKEVVPEIEAAPGAIEGSIQSATERGMLAKVRPGDFILSRTNAPLMRICLALLAQGTRATVQGKDIGRSLAALVNKAKAGTVVDLVAWLDAYRTAEHAKLARREAPETAFDAVSDKIDTLIALTEGVETVAGILARLEALFSDDVGAGKVICSTVHKAKGLEADTVWMLADTYRRGRSQEEDNIWYVAVTRAKQTLVQVQSACGTGLNTPQAQASNQSVQARKAQKAKRSKR